MSRVMKFISLVLVAVAVTGIVTGIAFYTLNNDPDNMEAGLYNGRRQIEEPGTILTIGEYEVSFEEYRYYYLSQKSLFTMYYGNNSNTYWENDLDNERAIALRTTTDDYLIYLYAWYDVAVENGWELDEDDLQEIEDTMEETKAEQGENGWASFLENNYYGTEENYMNIMVLQRTANKAQEEYQEYIKDEFGDELVDMSEYASVQHILISFNDIAAEIMENDPSLTAEDVTDEEVQELAEIRAQEIYAEIMESEDPVATFANMRELYDGDAAGQPEEGYTFGPGEMVEEFYEAALLLDEGEISEPVETDYGFHILLGNEFDREAYLDENFDSLAYTELNARVTEKEEEVIEGLEITYGTYYEDFLPANVK